MAAILHAARAWRPGETEGIGWLRLGVDIAEPRPRVVGGRVEVGAAPGWGLQVEPRGLVPETRWGLGFRAAGWLGEQRRRLARARLLAARAVSR